MPGPRPLRVPARTLPNTPDSRRHGQDLVVDFVDPGAEQALALARRAAGGRDVRIYGAADVIPQYLNSGVVDELEIALAPAFSGGGTRLFASLAEPGPRSRIGGLVHHATATHLRYVRMNVHRRPARDRRIQKR